MKAINGYVIFKKIEQQKTFSGIYLDNPNNIGVVEEFDNSINDLKKGDYIIYEPTKCHNFYYNNTQYYACKVTDIIVVIER